MSTKSPLLHFVSLNREWCENIRSLFDKKEATVSYGDIQKIPLENTAFISPANSMRFMDGGIDLALSQKMFPGVQTIIQAKIKATGH